MFAARTIAFVFLVVLSATVLTEAEFIPNPNRRIRRRTANDALEYIVVYKSGANQTAHNAWLDKQFTSRTFETATTEVEHSYNFGTWQAYAAKVPEALALKISHRHDIETVMEVISYNVSTVQQNVIPGLARTSAAAPGGRTYAFSTRAGAGVDVYVVDTGIVTTHAEFQGRARFGRSFVAGGQGGDGNGHGTHVAGTIGARTFGIAKQANLIAVRVFDASGAGSSAGVLRGLEFAIQSARTSGRRSVINMSLGGQGNDPVTTRAINTAINAGIVVVVAAGNENQDACNVTPANVASALTVGAIDPRNDVMASFSNFGRCVDISAPGVNIQSTWIGTSNTPGNRGLTNIISGTSMATPHAAGVAALILADNPTATATAVINRIISGATVNRIRSIKRNTVNRILFNGGEAGLRI